MERDANGTGTVELGPGDGAVIVRRGADGSLSVKAVYPAGTDFRRPPIENPPAAQAIVFGVASITQLFGREGDEPAEPAIVEPPSKPLIIGG